MHNFNGFFFLIVKKCVTLHVELSQAFGHILYYNNMCMTSDGGIPPSFTKLTKA